MYTNLIRDYTSMTSIPLRVYWRVQRKPWRIPLHLSHRRPWLPLSEPTKARWSPGMSRTRGPRRPSSAVDSIIYTWTSRIKYVLLLKRKNICLFPNQCTISKGIMQSLGIATLSKLISAKNACNSKINIGLLSYKVRKNLSYKILPVQIF